MALGVDKIAIWGTSYGTKLALAYALAYPTHVERLLLDSVLPTDYPEPLETNVLHDMPLALSGFCARRRVPCGNFELRRRRRSSGKRPRSHPGSRCRSASEREVAKRAHGRPRHARARRRLGSEPGPRCGAPGCDARSARRPDGCPPAAPLPRHRRLVVHGRGAERRASMRPPPAPTGISRGTERRRSPTARRSSVRPSARCRQARSARSALGRRRSARPRSASSGRAPPWRLRHSPAGPLPDVPVLALSGGYDMRTPTSSAAAVIRSFPHGPSPRRAGRRAQRRHGRSVVLRDPRRALLGDRRERAGDLPAAVLHRPARRRLSTRCAPGQGRLATGHARARRQDDQGGRDDVADDGIR